MCYPPVILGSYHLLVILGSSHLIVILIDLCKQFNLMHIIKKAYLLFEEGSCVCGVVPIVVKRGSYPPQFDDG